MVEDDGVASRIRRHRRARGLSLDEAAGLTGISKSYLSRLERGQRPVDSRALLRRIAEALEVPLADLLGQAATQGADSNRRIHKRVGDIRLALVDPDPHLGSDGSNHRNVIEDLLHEPDLEVQAREIPALLNCVLSAAMNQPSADSLQGSILTLHVTSFLLRNLGELDLSWLAAEKSRSLAEELADPAWTGLATFGQTHALSTMGAVRKAREVSEESLRDLRAANNESAAARGANLLVASTVAVRERDFVKAREYLTEADGVAVRFEETSVLNAFTSFSGWNALMHRVALEVEAERPAAALAAAESLMKNPVGSSERMSYFWVDVARAWAQRGNQRDAVAALRNAERETPLRTRLSPVVRDTIRSLIDAGQSRHVSFELRGLAERCGVLTD